MSCRRCLSWQKVTIQWKLSHGVWVILFRSPEGSGRLCNTCRFPEWVVGCFLVLIVLYRVWWLHLRVLQCLILPDVDMRLEQRIPHVCSLLYCWGAAVLHVQTRLLWVSSGSVTQLRGWGWQCPAAERCSIEPGLPFTVTYLTNLNLGACSRRKVMPNDTPIF